jgi:hypothetical protein
LAIPAAGGRVDGAASTSRRAFTPTLPAELPPGALIGRGTTVSARPRSRAWPGGRSQLRLGGGLTLIRRENGRIRQGERQAPPLPSSNTPTGRKSPTSGTGARGGREDTHYKNRGRSHVSGTSSTPSHPTNAQARACLRPGWQARPLLGQRDLLDAWYDGRTRKSDRWITGQDTSGGTTCMRRARPPVRHRGSVVNQYSVKFCYGEGA